MLSMWRTLYQCSYKKWLKDQKYQANFMIKSHLWNVPTRTWWQEEGWSTSAPALLLQPSKKKPFRFDKCRGGHQAMQNHEFRGRPSETMQQASGPGETRTLRKGKSLFRQNAQLRWSCQGCGHIRGRGTTGEMPPRGSAGLGGTGALRKFVYSSGREEEVETIYA